MQTTRRKPAARLNAAKVLQSAQAAINRWNRTARLRLRIPDDGIIQQGEWINLIVQPEKPGVTGLAYLNALETIESQIRSDGFENVVVVPTVGD